MVRFLPTHITRSFFYGRVIYLNIFLKKIRNELIAFTNFTISYKKLMVTLLVRTPSLAKCQEHCLK